MTESTKPAQCRDEDWNLARDCGLMGATPGTNAWDAALGRFADAIRAALAQQPKGEAKQAPKDCQHGYGDICAAGARDGVVCPEDSCDIDDGIRAAPSASAQQAEPGAEQRDECGMTESDWRMVEVLADMPRLTDERIDGIADAMPGGMEGFLKGWGWRQFARQVEEAVLDSAAPATPIASAQQAAVDPGIEFWKRMVSCLAGIIQDSAPIVGKEPGEESAEEIGRLLKQQASAKQAPPSAAPAALTEAFERIKRLALDAGGQGALPVPKSLRKIVRECLDSIALLAAAPADQDARDAARVLAPLVELWDAARETYNATYAETRFQKRSHSKEVADRAEAAGARLRAAMEAMREEVIEARESIAAMSASNEGKV
ncbi:hypothetical protein [Cupriavidus sp. BIC8F]|uniref:hypothetical protein n=1 Tax=Cupriavidus sp. BIC8F TaxID=3079014 RepID=UPI00291696E7|nr:hypothetical protein [Cupriavidus sp. BIC8F]